MIHVPDDIISLRDRFLCFNLKPLMWRVRGDFGDSVEYLDVWPHMKQYHHRGSMLQYEDICTVAGLLATFPAVRTPLEERAYAELQDRLDCIRHVIHMRQFGAIAY